MTKLLFILPLVAIGFTQSLIPVVQGVYDNGMPKEIKYYKSISNKLELFIVKEYHENGQIRCEKKYRDGDGKLNGKLTYYYENGQIREEGNYKDGKPNGKWTLYYENGQIKEEINYKDGKQDGKWTWYFENGEIQYEGNYKDGVLIE
tara:strand:- start:909 stop:1349 length:441 start_codon:yes stop_codon:yes gene_type:complete